MIGRSIFLALGVLAIALGQPMAGAVPGLGGNSLCPKPLPDPSNPGSDKHTWCPDPEIDPQPVDDWTGFLNDSLATAWEETGPLVPQAPEGPPAWLQELLSALVQRARETTEAPPRAPSLALSAPDHPRIEPMPAAQLPEMPEPEDGPTAPEIPSARRGAPATVAFDAFSPAPARAKGIRPIVHVLPAVPEGPEPLEPMKAGAGTPNGEATPLPRGAGGFSLASVWSAPSAVPEILQQGARVGALIVAGAAAVLVPWLTLYRRITQRRVLNNEVRRMAHAFVVAHPGATASDVSRALGVHYTTAEHHLEILGEFKFLNVRRLGVVERYFENHGKYSPAEERALLTLTVEGNVALLQLVARSPGLTQEEARIRLSLAKSTASLRVSKLLEGGLLTREGRNLRLTPTGAKALTAATLAGGTG